MRWLGVLLLLVVGCSSAPADVVTSTPTSSVPAATTSSVLVATVATTIEAPRAATFGTTLDAGPLSPRSGAVVLDIGDHLLVWGGDFEPNGGGGGNLGDGALYEWASGEWNMMAAGPLAPPVTDQSFGVWTGSEALLWGGDGAAAYDPVTDQWRVLRGAPQRLAAPHWTGSEVVDLVRRIRFDPAAGVTESIDSPPLPLARFENPAVVWTGGIGYAMLIEGAGPAVRGAAYNPEQRAWTELPALVTDERSLGGHETVAVWTGEQIVVTHADHTVLFGYTPATGEWERIADFGYSRSEGGTPLVASDDDLIATDLDVSAVRVGGEWHQVPGVNLRGAVQREDDTIVTFNHQGSRALPNLFLVFRPADVAAAPVRVVGNWNLDLAAGWVLEPDHDPIARGNGIWPNTKGRDATLVTPDGSCEIDQVSGPEINEAYPPPELQPDGSVLVGSTVRLPLVIACDPGVEAMAVAERFTHHWLEPEG